MSDREEVKLCPKCKGEIRKVLRGPWGDRREVEECDCPPPSKMTGWGRE